MVFKLKYAVLIAALGFSASALAAEKMNELSIFGNVSSTTTKATGGSKSTSDSSTVFLSYGYYFSPQLVGQIALGMAASSSGGSTTTYMMPGAGVKYYFQVGNKGDFVPFAGARLDLISVSTNTASGSGSDLTGFVGVSNFISETASLDLTLSYSTGSYKISGSTTDIDRTSFDIGFTQRF